MEIYDPAPARPSSDGMESPGNVTPGAGGDEAGARGCGLRAGRWLPGLAALLAPAVLAAGIYGYTGVDGGVYLSNVPGDARYAPLIQEPGVPATSAAALAPASTDSHLALIVQAARAHGIEPALLQAVAGVESGLDAAAVSAKGAMGLMQLMPDTASRYGVSDPFDPAANLDAGARHLRHLLERYQCDLSLALAAYNAGEGAVARHGGIPPYRETVAYVPRVLRRYQRLLDYPDPAGAGVSLPAGYSICPLGRPARLATLP